MTTAERINLIISLQKYSEQETHAISKWCCGIRDFEGYKDEVIPKIEAMLQAFVVRKRTGVPVTIKGIEVEFLGEDMRKEEESP